MASTGCPPACCVKILAIWLAIMTSFSADMGLLRRHLGNTAAMAGLVGVLALPFGRAIRGRHLDSRHLVLGTVRRPIRELGRHHVGLRVGLMERRVAHTW